MCVCVCMLVTIEWEDPGEQVRLKAAKPFGKGVAIKALFRRLVA